MEQFFFLSLFLHNFICYTHRKTIFFIRCSCTLDILFFFSILTTRVIIRTQTHKYLIRIQEGIFLRYSSRCRRTSRSLNEERRQKRQTKRCKLEIFTNITVLMFITFSSSANERHKTLKNYYFDRGNVLSLLVSIENYHQRWCIYCFFYYYDYFNTLSLTHSPARCGGEHKCLLVSNYQSHRTSKSIRSGHHLHGWNSTWIQFTKTEKYFFFFDNNSFRFVSVISFPFDICNHSNLALNWTYY